MSAGDGQPEIHPPLQKKDMVEKGSSQNTAAAEKLLGDTDSLAALTSRVHTSIPIANTFGMVSLTNSQTLADAGKPVEHKVYHTGSTAGDFIVNLGDGAARNITGVFDQTLRSFRDGTSTLKDLGTAAKTVAYNPSIVGNMVSDFTSSLAFQKGAAEAGSSWGNLGATLVLLGAGGRSAIQKAETQAVEGASTLEQKVAQTSKLLNSAETGTAKLTDTMAAKLGTGASTGNELGQVSTRLENRIASISAPARPLGEPVIKQPLLREPARPGEIKLPGEARLPGEPIKIKTSVEPIKAPAEPIKAPAEPIKAPAEPIKAPAEPIKAPAEPIKAPAEPIKAPAEPIKAPAEPIKSPHVGEPLKPSEPTAFREGVKPNLEEPAVPKPKLETEPAPKPKLDELAPKPKLETEPAPKPKLDELAPKPKLETEPAPKPKLDELAAPKATLDEPAAPKPRTTELEPAPKPKTTLETEPATPRPRTEPGPVEPTPGPKPKEPIPEPRTTPADLTPGPKPAEPIRTTPEPIRTNPETVRPAEPLAPVHPNEPLAPVRPGTTEPLRPIDRVTPSTPDAVHLKDAPVLVPEVNHPQIQNLTKELDRLASTVPGVADAQDKLATFKLNPTLENYKNLSDTLSTIGKTAPAIQEQAQVALEAARHAVVASAAVDTSQSLEKLISTANSRIASLPPGVADKAQDLLSQIRAASQSMMGAEFSTGQRTALEQLKDKTYELSKLLQQTKGAQSEVENALLKVVNAQRDLVGANYLLRTGDSLFGKSADFLKNYWSNIIGASVVGAELRSLLGQAAQRMEDDTKKVQEKSERTDKVEKTEAEKTQNKQAAADDSRQQSALYLNSKEPAGRPNDQREMIRKQNLSMYGIDGLDFAYYQRGVSAPVAAEESRPQTTVVNRTGFRTNTGEQQDKTSVPHFDYVKTRMPASRLASDNPYVSAPMAFRPGTKNNGRGGASGAANDPHASSLMSKNYAFVVGPTQTTPSANARYGGPIAGTEAAEKQSPDRASGGSQIATMQAPAVTAAVAQNEPSQQTQQQT